MYMNNLSWLMSEDFPAIFKKIQLFCCINPLLHIIIVHQYLSHQMFERRLVQTFRNSLNKSNILSSDGCFNRLLDLLNRSVNQESNGSFCLVDQPAIPSWSSAPSRPVHWWSSAAKCLSGKSNTAHACFPAILQKRCCHVTVYPVMPSLHITRRHNGAGDDYIC